MYAAWYDRQGSARDVLKVGALATPSPGPGELRVRVSLSGVNPGDTKKRMGWLGSAMPYPRVIPHSDAAGVVDAVGPGVDERRLGKRVWVYGAQSYRPFGTAAETVVVPERLAIDLPDNVSDEIGASLGIPGITAHRAVFSDGPVDGQTILVQGALGAVSSLAAQLARRAGATVIGTVRRSSDVAEVDASTIDHVVALDGADPGSLIREHAPDGVDRIIEVALSDNSELDASLIKNNTVIVSYFSRVDRFEMPFSPLLFDNVTMRFIGSDDFSAEAKRQATDDLTAAAAAGALVIPITEVLDLTEIAAAHDRVDAGVRGRILVRPI